LSRVAAEIGALRASPVRGPGTTTFIFETLTQLHAALDRVYKLAVTLPDAPLARFRAKTAGLPCDAQKCAATHSPPVQKRPISM
jgi:hypothetical protein